MTEDERLAGVLGALGVPAVHTPYTGRERTYITYHPLGEHIEVFGANRPMRGTVRYRVVIYAAGDYAQLRWQAYAALRAAGYAMPIDPGPEIYNSDTGMYGWPVTVDRRIHVTPDGQIMPEIKEV